MPTMVVSNQKLFDEICEKVDSAIDDLKSDIADTLGVEYEGKEETIDESEVDAEEDDTDDDDEEDATK